MAYVSTNTTSFGLVARLHAIKADVTEMLASYRVYRETFAELNSLSDRDLSDLGLGRSGITAIAREAAYGK